MVRVEEIDKILNRVLSNVEVKCTNREIRSKLKGMSQEEKFSLLSDKLNEAEDEHYKYLVNRREDSLRVIEEYKEMRDKYLEKGDDTGVGLIDSFLKHHKGDEFDDAIFYYEKRIMNGYKPKEQGTIPSYDLSKYRNEKDTSSEFDTSIDVRLGDIEKEQIGLQQGIGLTSDNYNALIDYFHNGYEMINSRLNNGKKWNGYSDSDKKDFNPELDEVENLLSDAIGKSKGLSEDTLLYHMGRFDVSKVVGDKVKFKGYTSSTFQYQVANGWSEFFDDNAQPMYVYRFLTPTGTKGICANDNTDFVLTHHREEHEYLLDKGLEGDIVDIDVKNHIVTLQL